MARSRTVLALVLAVVILVILAAATAYYVSLPPSGGAISGTACSGTKAYSGTVSNATGVGVPGVVVQLSVAAPNSGTPATATTGSGGTWSASLSGVCTYNARYFWQSATLGPRLASASALSASSSQTVHVAWQTVPVNLLNEYPNDASATVTVSMPDGLPLFVQANATGSIATGFLPTDAKGNPGYNITVSGFTRNNGSSPYVIYFPTAVVYRVQDENGNSVVYATPGTLQSMLSSQSVVDPLNMTAAIADVQAAGRIPNVQVAGHGTLTVPFNVTNATHALLGTVGTFYGSALQDYVTIRTNSTLYLGVDLTLKNTSNRNACFVVDAEGSVIHAWYYAIGNCP